MGPTQSKVRDSHVALGLGLLFFGLYALTVCRTVFWYDSAEYVTAAMTLGIPHPPGYPLYTILAHVFTWLPVDPALAVNVMSSVFAALAVAIVYLVGRRLELNQLGSGIGAASLGASKLFWSNANIAEVYCPALAVIALVFYLLLRGRDEGRVRWVLLAGLLAGLGLGIHLSIATCGLGFALLVWAGNTEVGAAKELQRLFGRNEIMRRVARSGGALAAAMAGSLVFLYLPIRASMKPALNFGDPSNWARFKWHVTGGNYKNWFAEDLDFIDRAGTIGGFFVDQLLVIGVALALAGVIALFRKNIVAALALSLAFVGNTFFFFDYQVHDLDVFFLPSTLVLCVFIGAGAEFVLRGISTVVTEERRQLMTRAVFFALIMYPVSLVLGHYREVDLSSFDDTDHFIENVVTQLPEKSIIINFTSPPEWKSDAVFGMYVQKVLKKRLDVVIAPPPRNVELIENVLRKKRAVYLYAPIGQVANHYILQPEHGLFRIVEKRR